MQNDIRFALATLILCLEPESSVLELSRLFKTSVSTSIRNGSNREILMRYCQNISEMIGETPITCNLIFWTRLIGKLTASCDTVFDEESFAATCLTLSILKRFTKPSLF